MYSNLIEKLSKKIDYYVNAIDASYAFDYGPEFEIALCKILQEFLPTKYGVCRGFIIDKHGSKAGDDIIIYDKLRFPTIRMLDKDFAQKEHVPIEAVYCYIEAKHNLELDNEDEATYKKALYQLSKIKKMTRSSRPLNQITEIVTLSEMFIANVPPGWTQILNPIHCSIISRKTSLKNDIPEKELKKGILDNESTYRAIQNISFPTDCVPDLVVAGEGVVVLPTYQTAVSKHLMPFYYVEGNNQPFISKTKNPALAVGLCQICWALERIQLGTMPWEEIIVNSLCEERQKH